MLQCADARPLLSWARDDCRQQRRRRCEASKVCSPYCTVLSITARDQWMPGEAQFCCSSLDADAKQRYLSLTAHCSRLAGCEQSTLGSLFIRICGALKSNAVNSNVSIKSQLKRAGSLNGRRTTGSGRPVSPTLCLSLMNTQYSLSLGPSNAHFIAGTLTTEPPGQLAPLKLDCYCGATSPDKQ